MGANNPAIALTEMRKGISEDSANAELWYNFGVAYANVQKFDSARYAWIKTLQSNPDTGMAKNARAALNSLHVVSANGTR